jgi:outer membrane lipoprotein-sorting protein
MIKKILLLLALIITTPVIYSHAKYEMTAEEYWEKLNNVSYIDPVEYKAKISVKYTNGKLKQKIFKAYIDGPDRAFIDVIAPASDPKVRILRLGDKVWLYTPNLKKSTLIEGDAIKKPFLESDLSYEDILINKKLGGDLYDAKFRGEGVVNKNIPIVKLELTAKDDSLTYYKKIIKVDKIRYFPWEINCVSKDGKLIKKIKTLEHKKTPPGNKFIITKFRIQDMTRKESVTYVELFFVKHGIEINEEYFTKDHLENK